MKTFNEIAAEHFKMPVAEIKDSLRPEDVPEWDSMNFLLFVADVEKNFSRTFTMDDVLTSQCLGDIRSALRAKGVDA